MVLQPGSNLDCPIDVSLFVALVFQLLGPGIDSCCVNNSHSILLASLGVLWHKLFYRVRELASFLTTDWRMRPLYLCPPRDRVAQLYSWTLSIHFSHLYDMHGVWWAYFCYWPSHGNCIMYTICVKTDYLWEFLMACEWKD